MYPQALGQELPIIEEKSRDGVVDMRMRQFLLKILFGQDEFSQKFYQYKSGSSTCQFGSVDRLNGVGDLQK